mmetsp:Transcript_22441/g.54312  ORF Transcript_22441/g.54312 Transcript_22441/m.54312 type:complete len:100 (+) Transcript_22441:98-397(+)
MRMWASSIYQSSTEYNKIEDSYIDTYITSAQNRGQRQFCSQSTPRNKLFKMTSGFLYIHQRRSLLRSTPPILTTIRSSIAHDHHNVGVCSEGINERCEL